MNESPHPPVLSVLVSHIDLMAGLYTQGKMATNQSRENCLPGAYSPKKGDHAHRIVAILPWVSSSAIKSMLETKTELREEWGTFIHRMAETPIKKIPAAYQLHKILICDWCVYSLFLLPHVTKKGAFTFSPDDPTSWVGKSFYHLRHDRLHQVWMHHMCRDFFLVGQKNVLPVMPTPHECSIACKQKST